MPKSTKISKIRFNRIRQSKSDYVKHFINQKLGTASATSLAFALGALFILNLGIASAQPSSTPPGGAVNARFDSVTVGAGGIAGQTRRECGPLSCYDTNSVKFNTGLSVPGITISGTTNNAIFEGSVFAQGAISNPSGNIRINDSMDITGNLNITGTIANPSSGGRIIISNEIDTRAGIINRGTANSGKVLINDELQVNENIDVRGYITNNNIIGGVRQPVSIEDDVSITGNVNITGGGRLNVYGEFGNFRKINGRVTGTSSNYPTAVSSCPSGYKIVSCSGQMSYNSNYQYHGSQSYGDTQDCYSLGMKTNTATTSTVNIEAQAICFRPY